MVFVEKMFVEIDVADLDSESVTVVTAPHRDTLKVVPTPSLSH
jgi:hypothetical protein